MNKQRYLKLGLFFFYFLSIPLMNIAKKKLLIIMILVEIIGTLHLIMMKPPH